MVGTTPHLRRRSRVKGVNIGFNQDRVKFTKGLCHMLSIYRRPGLLLKLGCLYYDCSAFPYVKAIGTWYSEAYPVRVAGHSSADLRYRETNPVALARSQMGAF